MTRSLSSAPAHRIEFDTTLPGLVVVRFEEGSTDEDWLRIAGMLKEHARQVPRFAVIADGSRLVSSPTARQRRIGGESTRDIVQLFPGRLVAWANVITSPFVRGAVTAINWIARPPYPVCAVATFEEAIAWIHETAPDLGAVRSLT